MKTYPLAKRFCNWNCKFMLKQRKINVLFLGTKKHLDIKKNRKVSEASRPVYQYILPIYISILNLHISSFQEQCSFNTIFIFQVNSSFTQFLRQKSQQLNNQKWMKKKKQLKQ